MMHGHRSIRRISLRPHILFLSIANRHVHLHGIFLDPKWGSVWALQIREEKWYYVVNLEFLWDLGWVRAVSSCSCSFQVYGTPVVTASDLRPRWCCATNPMKVNETLELRDCFCGTDHRLDSYRKPLAACIDATINVGPSNLECDAGPHIIETRHRRLCLFYERLTLGPANNSSVSYFK